MTRAPVASRASRPGVTLIELLVTLVILGVIAGVTVLTVRRIDPPRPSDPLTMFADSLRVVLASGRSVTLRVLTDSGPASGVVRVDGTIIADSILGLERLTGAPNRAR
jgi:prepilin-type N-terminal cleavage/methylation domain-containing protein